jgi:hypothetical protein
MLAVTCVKATQSQLSMLIHRIESFDNTFTRDNDRIAKTVLVALDTCYDYFAGPYCPNSGAV